ncbi:MAG: SUMF1/EgtB/PvdO family nonheme iron enzyme, partial [Candidatus Eisenbacteria bacterium]|nr:SUMF1/EgtB/PvdO family nonheme iron enzyme [Candidatus Eisenbacteria bacterium]
ALGRRLPSEPEWEKAARGNSPEYGDTILVPVDGGPRDSVEVGFGYPYPWGATLGGDRANYLDSGDPFETEVVAGTCPRGFFDGSAHGGFQTRSDASPYGASDLAGNVAEWTADWYGEYRRPHRPPEHGIWKVVRGGAWNRDASACVSTVRRWEFADERDPGIGFRTVGAP